MPLTLESLAREVGLPVHVATGLDRPVAWVHSTELADPTPFLEGGELLLTTGIALGPHRAYVRRLVDAGAVGLGFGTGLSHATVPADLVAAARAAGLPLVEVPRRVPFIAITKAVSRAVAADEYANLTRTSDAQRALTRAALTSTEAVVRRLAVLIGGAVALLDASGETAHVSGELPDLREEARRLGAGPAGSAWQAGERHLAMQVLGRRGYLAVATAGPLDAADRHIVNTAASLLTLALAQSDAVDGVRRDLRTAQFRLLLAGLPVADAPAGPFRVFVLPKEVSGARPVEPPGFRAEYEGHVVVLAQEVDGPAHASGEVDAGSVARGYREALRAAEEKVATFADVPGSGLLATDAAQHAATLLAPLDAPLRESLRVWLGCHGQWDPAAAKLGVHRHTMRNRVRRAEELLGRSLDSPGVRAELWFALHAGQ
ncbi:PucR family transcriptional regulator [Actinosynnema sp. NPDC047251]|uniref:Transcriptional regulator, PucR family n=1 Tax=Saccharothrix espanaensis (strain ATCC 51144 / DSM 44229 / JCM 9112 / NBRC 15066 / NRRL 15764) TaxID=1179773 RepID=K0K9U6_SACES|nr:PucR family transcriptional regulator [Saccharothrix espanaensis]CCH33413.1 Transcriptional regulator, PucR family [Saccharothrix espanaensis DSM 44229]